MTKHYKGYICGLCLFLVCIWAGAYALHILPEKHWAIAPTIASMGLGIWVSIIITIMAEYND